MNLKERWSIKRPLKKLIFIFMIHPIRYYHLKWQDKRFVGKGRFRKGESFSLFFWVCKKI